MRTNCENLSASVVMSILETFKIKELNRIAKNNDIKIGKNKLETIMNMTTHRGKLTITIELW